MSMKLSWSPPESRHATTETYERWIEIVEKHVKEGDLSGGGVPWHLISRLMVTEMAANPKALADAVPHLSGDVDAAVDVGLYAVRELAELMVSAVEAGTLTVDEAFSSGPHRIAFPMSALMRVANPDEAVRAAAAAADASAPEPSHGGAVDLSDFC
jgi:hypothetical protein